MRRNNFKNPKNNHSNNCNKNKVSTVKKTKISMEDQIKHELICRSMFTELKFEEINEEIQQDYSNLKQTTPFTILETHINKKLKEIKSNNIREEKQILPPMDVKFNNLFFPFQVNTSDRIMIANLKYILQHQLAINYFITNQNSSIKPERSHYNFIVNNVKKIYDLSYELKINQFFKKFDNTLVPYLHNESSQFRSYELFQGIGVGQLLNNKNISLHSKTTPGPGDFFVYNNNHYILLDIKSADLSESQIKDLLIKNINNYKKFDKSYLCLNGNEEEIKNIINKENIEIPDNIILIYQNTQETFKNNGFYEYFNPNLINMKIFYQQLSQPHLKKEIQKLLNKHTLDNTLDVINFGKDLKQLIDLNSFIEFQNLGDNFFDPETISDFNDFISNINNNN